MPCITKIIGIYGKNIIFTRNIEFITCPAASGTRKYERTSAIFEPCRHSIGVAPITQVNQVRNENSNIQGMSLYVAKSDFPYYKELLIKERIRSLWEQIPSIKRSSHFEKALN